MKKGILLTKDDTKGEDWTYKTFLTKEAKERYDRLKLDANYEEKK